MQHFFLTGKLLSESTFLTEIRKINTDFISLDSSEYDFYLARSQSFELTTTAWLRKCSDTTTLRLENGAMQSFMEYACNRIYSLIKDDASNFIADYQSGKVKDLVRFQEELNIIRAHVSNAPYLSPIADRLLTGLDTVESDISSIERIENIVSVNDGEDFLIWSGPVNTLCTLFHDLRTQKPTNSKQVYLDYLPKDLEKFILKHFRKPNGKPFSASSIKTDLDPKREDKRATRNRIIIQ